MILIYRGAQNMCSAHHERKTRNPFNSNGVHRAHLKALEALSSEIESAGQYSAYRQLWVNTGVCAC